MPSLDLMDETFILAAPLTVARLVADSSRWPRWWPGLALTVAEDRGRAGIRWQVGQGTTQERSNKRGGATWERSNRRGGATRERSNRRGRLTGTMEIWVEPHLDGAIAHHYLRVDPAGRRLGRRARRYWARQAKRALWSMKDELESARPVGAGLRSPGRAS